MSRDLGRDVPGSEKLCARELWADFSFPFGRGLATSNAQNTAKKCPPGLCPPTHKGAQGKGCRKRRGRDSPAPTPSIRQPLFQPLIYARELWADFCSLLLCMRIHQAGYKSLMICREGPSGEV